MKLLSNMRVRAATMDDLNAIMEVHQASIADIAPSYYTDEIVKDWLKKKEIQQYRDAMTVNGEVFFVAEFLNSPGPLAGFSSFLKKDGKSWLQAIYVRGAASRQGVGKALLKTVEDYAAGLGFADLYVEASLSGEDFYKAEDFIEIERLTRPLPNADDIMIETIMMMKPI